MTQKCKQNPAMSAFRKVSSFVLATGSCLVTSFALLKLALFLSTPGEVRLEKVWFYNFLDNATLTNEILSTVVMDLLLLSLFILPHSLLKADAVKAFFHRRGLATWERSTYCLMSSCTLLVLMHNWASAPGLIVWRLDVAKQDRLWWVFVLLHGFAWAIVCGGSLIMDLPEILGAKQIHHEANHLAPPILYKTAELRRLYGHVRHPSFVCITVILWAVNILTLDRLLLNVLLTLYMYLAWNTDSQDYQYHKGQLYRKKYELSLNLSEK
ncbi:nurim homolog [Phlebotomus argentipes]|uniref:nurim homolog n=1 Tax=Phlebotomus argentipes TaxID=94469 RepID=UPI002893528C|nr:nurim homolog [Phlebotomus argentipes]